MCKRLFSKLRVCARAPNSGKRPESAEPLYSCLVAPGELGSCLIAFPLAAAAAPTVWLSVYSAEMWRSSSLIWVDAMAADMDSAGLATAMMFPCDDDSTLLSG